jgi:raffinose/stachyose/melibiose transport system permease protein
MIGHYLFLIIFSILILAPFVWVVISSLKSKDQYVMTPGSFPNPIHPENYIKAVQAVSFPTLFKNSLFLSSVSTAGAVIVSSMASFVLARYTFKLSKLCYTYLLMGMMIPLNAAIIPLFLFFRNVGLLNTYQGVLIPYIAFQIPMGIFLITNYMKTIPAELEESAIIDGCGGGKLFLQIILPLSRPILATYAIITFIGLWNEFLFALVLLTGEKFRTIPLGLATFRGQYDTNATVMLAATVISIIPVIIIYVLLRDNIVKGMTAGAVKG